MQTNEEPPAPHLALPDWYDSDSEYLAAEMDSDRRAHDEAEGGPDWD